MKYLLTILALAAITARSSTENFDTETGPALPAGWKTYGTDWSVRGGALWKRGGGDRHHAVWEGAGTGNTVTVEATVTVRRRETGGWGVMGVAIRRDASNFWHFALVEAPADKGGHRYVEISERLDNVHNAHTTAPTWLKSSVKQGDRFAWELDHPYRLRLQLGGGKVEGTLSETDGTIRARIGCEFTNRAVTSGTPAFVVSQFVTVFDDLRAEVESK